MASKVKRDPLSRYFKDLDDFEISSGEDSDEDVESKDKAANCANSVPAQLPKAKTIESENQANLNEPSKPLVKKLPSAHECLKNQSTPAFLRLNQQKEVDWDKNIKSLENPEDVPVDFETNAVPPPTSYEPVADTEAQVEDSDSNKRKRNGDEQDQATPSKAYKVHKDEEDETS